MSYRRTPPARGAVPILAFLVAVLAGAAAEPAAAASLYIDPTAVDLGYLNLNEGAIFKVAVVNVGDTPAQLDVRILDQALSGYEIVRGGGPHLLAPGERHVAWVMTLISQYYRHPVAELSLGPDAPTVPLSASSTNVVPHCAAGTRELDFDQVALGDSLTFSVPISSGSEYLNLALSTTDPAFSVNPATLSLPIGSTVNVAVTYKPGDVGTSAGSLILAGSDGVSVTLRGEGVPAVVRTEDLVGVWLDSGLSVSTTENVTAGLPFDAWLAMVSPSETDGVGGWELALDLDDNTFLTEVALEGLSYNILAPPEFCVGLAEPLPQAPLVVLARLKITTVDQQWHEIRVKPISRASIAGSMAWAFGPEYSLKPLYPATGLPAVAWFRASTTVAVAAPEPTAVLADGAVVLSWPLPTDGAGGCHVYRAVDGNEARLTRSPLVPSGSGYVYRDDLAGVPAGATAAYSYAVVRGGTEIVRSPAVTVEVPGAAGVTRLVGAQPNPFNPETAIVFELARSGPVRLEVFDVSGRRVAVLADGVRPAGRQRVVWQGRDDAGRALPSGAYFARLDAGTVVATQRLMLVK